MLLRPLRRAPMMLGGVGYQIGLDEARRKRIEAQRPAPDVVKQIQDLHALRASGALSPEEFQMAKRKVLDG